MINIEILTAANAASLLSCHTGEGRYPVSLCVINVVLRTLRPVTMRLAFNGASPPPPFRGAPIQIYISRAFASALRPPETSLKWAAFILILLRNITRVHHVRPFPHTHTHECARVYICVQSFFNYFFNFMRNGRTWWTRPYWMRKMGGRFGRTQADAGGRKWHLGGGFL